MDAVILCGGFGTRLKEVVKDVPKSMAPVNGKPFLEHILNFLDKNTIITNVLLCTGYKHEIIYNYFKDHFKRFSIQYSIESIPLGTGGAVLNALPKIKSDSFLLINGDTYFDVDLSHLHKMHLVEKADVSIALKKMTNFERYGCVQRIGKTITAFEEKKKVACGEINGGVYIVNKQILLENNFSAAFSLEKDLLEKFTEKYKFIGISFDGYFIDVGTPEDYVIAQKVMR